MHLVTCDAFHIRCVRYLVDVVRLPVWLSLSNIMTTVFTMQIVSLSSGFDPQFLQGLEYGVHKRIFMLPLPGSNEVIRLLCAP